MTTTWIEVERYAGALYAQIELEVTGTVVPAQRQTWGPDGGQPSEPASVEDLEVEVWSVVVSLADEDEDLLRSPAPLRMRASAAVRNVLVRLGFDLELTAAERARAEDGLCEAAEAILNDSAVNSGRG